MRLGVIIVAAAAALAAGAAQAQSAQELLKSKNCLNCHEADKKKVGPSFKDIAAKHKGNKDAEAALSAKLREGKGHPKVAAADAEMKSMLQAILSAK